MSVVTTLSAATSLVKNSNPPITTITIADDTYVLFIVNQPKSNSYASGLALSSASSVISLRDPATLQEKRRWDSHRSLTHLKCNSDGQLISSGKDGLVHQWDERTKGGIKLTCQSTLGIPRTHLLNPK
jgi:WD40 repeat protein